MKRIGHSKALHGSLSTTIGWTMPVDTNTFHITQLRTDVDLPGIHTLTLSGAAFRVWQSAAPSTNDAPLLVSGQTVTNGVNGISWGSSSTASLYVQPVTNGTSILTYAYIGTGSASGIVCRASMKMTAWSMKFVGMWEKDNPANRIYNPTVKDDPPEIQKNMLYVAEPPEGVFRIMLDVEIAPASVREKLRYALLSNVPYFKLGTGEGWLSASGPQEIAFSVPAYEVMNLEVVLGSDGNRNGTLDDWEYPGRLDVAAVPKENEWDVHPAMICTANASYYDSAAQGMADIFNGSTTTPSWATEWLLPHAKRLLQIFYNGGIAGVPQDKQPTGSSSVTLDAHEGTFAEWLTHNTGAEFDNDGVATIQEYYWNFQTSLADLIATAPQIEDPIEDFYDEVVYANAAAFFANKPVGTTNSFPTVDGYDIPHEHESPSWVAPFTITFNNWWPDLGDDLNGTIGRGRLLSHKARFTIEKQDALIGTKLVVVGVKSWGTVTDLYDFNFDGGGETEAARKAAALQIGHGNGSYGNDRAHGIIYRTRIDFDKTYTEMP